MSDGKLKQWKTVQLNKYWFLTPGLHCLRVCSTTAPPSVNTHRLRPGVETTHPHPQLQLQPVEADSFSPFPPTWSWFHSSSRTQFWTVLSISTKIKLVWNPESWFPAKTKNSRSFLGTEVGVSNSTGPCVLHNGLCWWHTSEPHNSDQWWKKTHWLELTSSTWGDSTTPPVNCCVMAPSTCYLLKQCSHNEDSL